jgi:hypothetical protein
MLARQRVRDGDRAPEGGLLGFARQFLVIVGREPLDALRRDERVRDGLGQAGALERLAFRTASGSGR